MHFGLFYDSVKWDSAIWDSAKWGWTICIYCFGCLLYADDNVEYLFSRGWKH